jgi:hypothetical protein
MRLDKEQAIKLRLKGRSYSEIRDELDVPKSTLSGWLSKIVIRSEFKKRIMGRAHKKSLVGLLKRNVNQTNLAQRRARDTRTLASNEVELLFPRDLMVAGIALYWAEGYKRPVIRNGIERTYHVVSLTNSDPALVKIFLRFLREHCKVPNERIRANLRLFPHQNANAIIEFWQKETRILPDNFSKVTYPLSRASAGKRPFNRLEYGVIQVSVGDTALYHRIMGYIDGLQKFV